MAPRAEPAYPGQSSASGDSHLCRRHHCDQGRGTRRCTRGVALPNINAFAERFVSTISRERLDHVLILNEPLLRHLVSEFVGIYNTARSNQGVNQERPERRSPEINGHVVALPAVNRLHHDYHRAA